MFYNVSLLNSTNKVKPLSIKKLYVLYSIFNNSKLPNYGNSNFLDFNIYLYYSQLTTNKTLKFTFLSLFFFFKTFDILSVSKVNEFNFSTKKYKLFSVNITNTYFSNLSSFWKKWGSLKRPISQSKLDVFFLDDFKKKLSKYSNLGFVKTYDNYILLKTNTELLSDKLVSFSKSLLISPKYSSSSINKYISLNNLSEFEFQFLRKNKVYNKGRYSRTRQNYRTGVYLCMYLSVISIFGLYYWFFKFSFNFTYLWWLFISFIASFFIPKIFKYRLYEPNTLLNKFFDLFRWFFLLLKSFFR